MTKFTLDSGQVLDGLGWLAPSYNLGTGYLEVSIIAY